MPLKLFNLGTRPKPEESEEQPQEDLGLFRTYAPSVVRGAAGFAGFTPWTGALAGGGGEILAEMIEKGTFNPLNVDPSRVTAETLVGASMGKWAKNLNTLVKGSKAGKAALQGLIFGGSAPIIKHTVEEGDPNPLNYPGEVVSGGTIGALTGGGLAKMANRTKGPLSIDPRSVVDEAKPTDALEDLVSQVTAKGPSSGVSDVGMGGLRVGPDVPRVRKPGGTMIRDDLGRGIDPEIPKVAEAKRAARAESLPSSAPVTSGGKHKRLTGHERLALDKLKDLEKGIADALPESKANRALNETVRKAESRLLKQEQAADLQDIRARQGGTDLGTIKRGEAKAQVKELADQEKLALNQAKLDKIAAESEGRVPTDYSIREGVSATTPAGVRKNMSRSLVKETEEGIDEAAEDALKSGGYSVDKVPSQETVSSTLYTNKALARKHADAYGGPAAGVDVQQIPGGGYAVRFKGQETPLPTPTPKAPGGVAKALEAARPYNQLSPSDKEALTPIIQKAVSEGYTGDLEQLGDEVAGRLQSIREGRALVKDTGNSADELLAEIRKLGGISTEAETTFPGELKELIQNFAQPGKYKGAKGNLRSGNLLFRKGGQSFDRILEGLKQSGRFPHIKSTEDLRQLIRQAAQTKEQGSDVDELASSLRKGWWKKAPVEGELTVEDFATALTKEGEKPIAEVPFTLTGEAPKGAKAVQPTLEETPTAFPARLFKSAREAAGEGYGAVKAAKAAGEKVPEEGRAIAGRAAQRISQEAKAKEAPINIKEQLEDSLKARGSDQSWIDDALKQVEEMKKGGPRGGSTISALGAGQLRNMFEIAKENPAFAAKLVGTLGGGAIGAGVNEEDPLLGALVGGGIGFGAGAAASKLPQLLSESGNIKDVLEPITQRIPNWMRGGLLSDPRSIVYNAFAGPWGSNLMGGIEQTAKGIVLRDPEQLQTGKDILKSAGNIPQWLKTFKDKFPEAAQRIHDVEDLGRAGDFDIIGDPNIMDRLSKYPATWMLGGDLTVMQNLMEAGIPEDLARRITLTAEPRRSLGKNLANWGKSSPSVITQMMLPFKRTAGNIIDSGLERTPIVGSIMNQFGNQDLKISGLEQLTQEGLGLGVLLAAYQAGKSTDQDTNRRFKLQSLVSNLGGQYALLANAGFAAGQAAKAGRNPYRTGAYSALMDMPLPSTEPVGKTGEQIAKLLSGELTKEDITSSVFVPRLYKFATEAEDIAKHFQSNTRRGAPLPERPRQRRAVPKPPTRQRPIVRRRPEGN
jgi:hypothetical protein